MYATLYDFLLTCMAILLLVIQNVGMKICLADALYGIKWEPYEIYVQVVAGCGGKSQELPADHR